MFNVNQMRPFLDANGASRIVVNGQVLNTNATATLRYQDWLDIDREVITVAKKRLVGIQDLMSRGLTYSLGSIGIVLSMFERESDMTAAQVTMAPETDGERDRLNYDTQSVPVPFVHKEFQINARALAANAASGVSLDMSSVAGATRKVAETSESMLFAGSAVKVDGSNAIYGYTSHPDRNTVDLSLAWDDNSKTGAQIVADVMAMVKASRGDRMFGPWVLYIPTDYESKLDEDYKPGTNDNRTIRERILAINGIEEIKVADQLADDTVLLVSLTRETVDLAIGQDITTIQWDEKGGLLSKFKVLACWAPRVKSEFDGRCGVVHLRAAA